MTFSGFGSYRLDAGSSWTLNGTNTLGVGVNLTSAGSLTVSGTVRGGGTLAIGGGTATIGGSGTVANLSLAGGTTYLDRSLTITGVNAFNEGAVAALTLGSGDTLSIMGATTLSGLIDGYGSVTLANGGTVGSLAIGGAATLILAAGAVTENDAMSIGGGTAGNASLLIDPGATWTIGFGLDVQHGSATGYIEVDGRLVGSCLDGTKAVISEIACPISVTSTGTIEAQAGPLILNGSVTGTGTLQIDSGASLTVNASCAPTLKATLDAGTKAQTATFTVGPYASFAGAITCLGAYDTIDFNPHVAFTGAIDGFGANDTIDLDPKAVFTGAIDGFGIGGTIDLLKTAANGASVNAQDQLVIVDGTTTVATLQLTGSYGGATFHFSADGSGGTDVTLATAGSKPPPGVPSLAQSVQAMNAAMAALGPRAGSVVAASAPDEAWRPTLLGPRPQLA